MVSQNGENRVPPSRWNRFADWLGQVKTKTVDFLHNDLWVVDIRGLSSGYKRAFFRTLRVTRMVANIDGFSKISKNAQALTYMVSLSIIPMLTVALWLTSGTIWNFIKRSFGRLLPTDTNLLDVLRQSGISIPQGLIDSIAKLEGTLPGISAFSVAILIGSIALTLLGVEDNVNDVYGINRSRPYHKRILIWSSMVVLAPITPALIMIFPGRHLIHNMWERMQPGLLVAKDSLQRSMQSGIQQLTDLNNIVNEVKGPIKEALLTRDSVIFCLLLLVSFTAIFALLYKILPYTKVKMSSSLISGGIAGFIWFLWDLVFVVYAMWPGTTSKIYGSLAIIPFFILWLYVSWVIFLYGAKICYAIQYAPNYDPAVENGNYATRELERACCRIFLMLEEKWHALLNENGGVLPDDPLYSVEELVGELKVPLRIVEKSVDALEAAKLIRVTGRDNVKAPVEIFLNCQPEDISISDIQRAVRNSGAERTLPLKGPMQEYIDNLLDDGLQAEEKHLSKIKFADLEREKVQMGQESS